MFNNTLNTLISVLGGDATNLICQSSSDSSSNTFLGKFIQPIVSLLEGFAPAVMFPEYSLPKKRLSFGQNFCAAGTVVLSEWDVVVNALTSPQARTFRLGTGILESSHLPGMVIGKRNTWVSCF